MTPFDYTSVLSLMLLFIGFFDGMLFGVIIEMRRQAEIDERRDD